MYNCYRLQAFLHLRCNELKISLLVCSMSFPAASNGTMKLLPHNYAPCEVQVFE